MILHDNPYTTKLPHPEGPHPKLQQLLNTLWFRILTVGFRVEFRVWGFVCLGLSLGFGVLGVGFSLGFRVYG